MCDVCKKEEVVCLGVRTVFTKGSVPCAPHAYSAGFSNTQLDPERERQAPLVIFSPSQRSMYRPLPLKPLSYIPEQPRPYVTHAAFACCQVLYLVAAVLGGWHRRE